MIYVYSQNNHGNESVERYDSESDLQSAYKSFVYDLNESYGDYTLCDVIPPGYNIEDALNMAMPNAQAIVQTVKDADEDGMSRPFYIICHLDCDYEAVQSEDKIDFWNLFLEWLDYGAYEVTPRQYMSGEITPDQADQQGLYALAEAIREDEGLEEDDDNEGEDEGGEQ